MQFSTGVPRTVRSFSAIACSILRVFRKVISVILRHFTTAKFPDVRQSRLFEFLVKALKDTTPGRCRRLRCLPFPHRRLIQEQHFQNPKFSKSDVPDFLIFAFLYLFTMALKDTTLGRCGRLRRLPIPHRRLIQEQHFQNPKLSKSRSLAATTGRATVQARGGAAFGRSCTCFELNVL